VCLCLYIEDESPTRPATGSCENSLTFRSGPVMSLRLLPNYLVPMSTAFAHVARESRES
jgi:hypothetical protein